MKRVLLLVLCLVVFLASSLSASAATIYSREPQQAVATNADGKFVPVHNYFAKGKPAVDRIPNGEIIEVLPGFSPDGKYNHVVYDNGNKAGWVLGQYIKIIK